MKEMQYRSAIINYVLIVELCFLDVVLKESTAIQSRKKCDCIAVLGGGSANSKAKEVTSV